MSNDHNRKLVAILFADIAGYTAMMQKSEAETLLTVKKFREILEDTVPNYNGEIIHYYGDGSLVAFKSSTNGVQCALALQKLFGQSPPIPVRIGLHLGEVLFEDDNVYGDGVNIASRIESIGVPGAILMSKSLHKQIKNKSEFKACSLGKFEFKNVEEPIEVFALSNEGLTIPDKRFIVGKLKESKPSLFYRRDVQVSAILINLLIVILLAVWYWDYFTKDDALIVPQGNKYVLAIGVDNNPDWLRLYNAKNDALGVVDVLKEYFGFETFIEPLINKSATKQQILNSIDQAKKVLNEDDQLLIFYAGHGYSHFTKGSDDPEGYIVPYDGPGEEIGDLSGYLKISDLLKKIADLPALHITTIFDACYSGFALQDQLLVSRGSSHSLKEALINTSRKVFSSADYDQIAADSGPIAEHSLYSGFLIEGLKTGQADSNADEIISMNELAIYLETSIFDYSSSRQIPRYGNFMRDKGGEMLLQYNLEQVKKDIPDNVLIKGKDEVYTALPFRTSTTDVSLISFATFLPEIIIDALGEYDKGEYKIVNLNLLAETDSASTNTPLIEYIKRSGITKYLSGTFNSFENKSVVKISLHEAKDASIIYTFPDIISESEDENDLALLTKKYVKGFLDNTEQVMTRITNPPIYDAYKELKRAYNHMRNDDFNDRDQALKYINKAIEIDPKYFRAHLAKVWSFVACHPVDISKAKEEYGKLEAKDFNISDYEEERLSFLFYEAVGDYPKLVKHKLRILKDYPNRSVFNDALWYAISANNHSAAYEMIRVVEANDLDADFKNDIFTWKNIIERQKYPSGDPKYYARFKRESNLIENRFKHFLRSKLFYDCKENCLNEVENLINQYAKRPAWICFKEAGTITAYKGNEKLSATFYSKALELYKQTEDPTLSNLISFQYLLKNHKKCKAISENMLDSLIVQKDFSSIRYYILSKIQIGEEITDKEFLMNKFLTFKNRPGICYYYLATIHCAEGNFKESIRLLKMALENSIPFDYNTYMFDPDLKPMWDDPKFIVFTTPK